jgi:hypothetical protein
MPRLAALLLLVPAAGCFSLPTLTLDGGFHAVTMDGSIGLSNTSTTDVDTIDLSSQLDLGDTETTPYVRAGLELGPLDVTAWGFTNEASGRGVATADFGGITAGSVVESDLDLTMAQGRLLFDVVNFDLVEAGVGLAVQWVDLQLEVEEEVFGLREAIDVQQPVPLLAARVGVDLGEVTPLPLSVEVAAAGLRASYADIDGTILDLEALARLQWGLFGVFGGWRYLHIDIEGEADGQAFDGDVELTGAIAGLSLRF